ncbi:MAG: LacI family DNA-binding transcriptional regulator [Bacteroidales bacterium]|nr:LacI family DNA-binding transcriptional regulator [Bacteroidales bacterium]
MTARNKSHKKDIPTPGRIRIIDIAKLAGISIGTVDRVLHNRGEVSDNTRKKIMSIINDMNYKPDILARRLASKNRCRFGVLFPRSNPDSSFWQAPIEGVQKAINEIDFYNVVGEEFLFNQFDRSSFSKKTKALLDYNPDGALIAPVYYEESIELVTAFKNQGIPYVFINSMIDGLNDYCFVGQDSFQSGFLAAKLLTYGMPPESSYCVINLARSLNNHKHIMSRQKGFEEYFHTVFKGRANVYIYDIEDTGEAEVNDSLLRIFISHKNLDGVFVTNSRVFKVARFLKFNKIRSLRLIGYDLINENIEFLEDGTVDFLISQKPFDQGYMGIRALFNLIILRKPINREYYLPIEVLTRENYRYHRIDILKEGLY